MSKPRSDQSLDEINLVNMDSLFEEPANQDTQAVEEYKLGGTSKTTAQKAAKILEESGNGFYVPNSLERRKLLVAFAERGLTLYGKAFDIIKIPTKDKVLTLRDIEDHFHHLLIYEIKSTNKISVKDDFTGYFFSLSTAELLTAQNLGEKYKFILVNTVTKKVLELSLRELYAKAKGIYPSWSVQL
jgi:hypothetical protein